MCSSPHPQVEMLYEEALYTILYRAGTMGPNQVDDQEALLGYLQQVSPLRPAHPALGRTTPNLFPHLPMSLSPEQHTQICPMYTTHKCVCPGRHTYRLTGTPRRMNRQTDTHTHTCIEHKD